MTPNGTPGICRSPLLDWIRLPEVDPVLGLAAVMLLAVVVASALYRP
jgi:hypothetical protein